MGSFLAVATLVATPTYPLPILIRTLPDLSEVLLPARNLVPRPLINVALVPT